MKDIRDRIRSILMEGPTREYKELPKEAERYEAADDFETEDVYGDLYLLVRNVDDFYGPRSEPKAARLLESFLLESLVVVKSDPEVLFVESGDDYVKATAFAPDGETAVELFDDAVEINTMLELYNDALAENGFPQIEAGIGLAAFQDEQGETYPDAENVTIGGEEAYEYAYDSRQLALRLAEFANNGEFDPIVMDEAYYGILADIDEEKKFLDENMQKIVFEGEDFAVFHGNIIVEED